MRAPGTRRLPEPFEPARSCEPKRRHLSECHGECLCRASIICRAGGTIKGTTSRRIRKWSAPSCATTAPDPRPGVAVRMRGGGCGGGQPKRLPTTRRRRLIKNCANSASSSALGRRARRLQCPSRRSSHEPEPIVDAQITHIPERYRAPGPALSGSYAARGLGVAQRRPRRTRR